MNDNRLPTSPHPPSADYFGTGVRGTGEERGRGGASKCHSTLGSAQRAGTLLTNAGTDLKLSNPQAGTLLRRPKWTFQTGQPTDQNPCPRSFWERKFGEHVFTKRPQTSMPVQVGTIQGARAKTPSKGRTLPAEQPRFHPSSGQLDKCVNTQHPHSLRHNR